MTYLASPYSHADPTVRFLRYDAACRYAAKLMHQGRHVFSPIAHSHPVAVAGGLVGDGVAVWEVWCLDMVRRCDEFWVLTLDGWQDSVGIARELVEADRCGMRPKFVEMT